MYQKFIINQDGVLRFGRVYLHRDLLSFGESCPYGGGLWKGDEARGIILLYGRSFDFGPPCMEQVRRIDWTGTGLAPQPLFYLPCWPNEEIMQPIFAVKQAIEFYNERPHMSLEWKTPAEAALCTGELKKKWVSHREKFLKQYVA